MMIREAFWSSITRPGTISSSPCCLVVSSFHRLAFSSSRRFIVLSSWCLGVLPSSLSSFTSFLFPRFPLCLYASSPRLLPYSPFRLLARHLATPINPEAPLYLPRAFEMFSSSCTILQIRPPFTAQSTVCCLKLIEPYRIGGSQR